MCCDSAEPTSFSVEVKGMQRWGGYLDKSTLCVPLMWYEPWGCSWHGVPLLFVLYTSSCSNPNHPITLPATQNAVQICWRVKSFMDSDFDTCPLYLLQMHPTFAVMDCNPFSEINWLETLLCWWWQNCIDSTYIIQLYLLSFLLFPLTFQAFETIGLGLHALRDLPLPLCTVQALGPHLLPRNREPSLL